MLLAIQVVCLGRRLNPAPCRNMLAGRSLAVFFAILQLLMPLTDSRSYNWHFPDYMKLRRSSGAPTDSC